jgi:hypothetical protein
MVKVALHGAQLFSGPRGHDSLPAIGSNAFVVDDCLDFSIDMCYVKCICTKLSHNMCPA